MIAPVAETWWQVWRFHCVWSSSHSLNWSGGDVVCSFIFWCRFDCRHQTHGIIYSRVQARRTTTATAEATEIEGMGTKAGRVFQRRWRTYVERRTTRFWRHGNGWIRCKLNTLIIIFFFVYLFLKKVCCTALQKLSYVITFARALLCSYHFFDQLNVDFSSIWEG